MRGCARYKLHKNLKNKETGCKAFIGPENKKEQQRSRGEKAITAESRRLDPSQRTALALYAMRNINVICVIGLVESGSIAEEEREKQ